MKSPRCLRGSWPSINYWQTMALEANGVRAELRELVVVGANRIWPGEASSRSISSPRKTRETFTARCRPWHPRTTRRVPPRPKQSPWRPTCGRHAGVCSSRPSRPPCQFRFWRSWSHGWSRSLLALACSLRPFPGDDVGDLRIVGIGRDLHHHGDVHAVQWSPEDFLGSDSAETSNQIGH